MRPWALFLSDDLDEIGMWRWWPREDTAAHVEVQPQDRIGLLDLRFAVGLLVFVTGTDRDRVKALHDACVDVGAKRVLSYVMQPRGTEYRAVEEFFA